MKKPCEARIPWPESATPPSARPPLPPSSALGENKSERSERKLWRAVTSSKRVDGKVFSRGTASDVERVQKTLEVLSLLPDKRSNTQPVSHLQPGPQRLLFTSSLKKLNPLMTEIRRPNPRRVIPRAKRSRTVTGMNTGFCPSDIPSKTSAEASEHVRTVEF